MIISNIDKPCYAGICIYLLFTDTEKCMSLYIFKYIYVLIHIHVIFKAIRLSLQLFICCITKLKYFSVCQPYE